MANQTTPAIQIQEGKVGIGEVNPSAKLHVSGTNDVLLVEGSGSKVFEVQGSQGQLFSVTDSLSGSLFAVSDISGIPILEVTSHDNVSMGTYGNNTLVVSQSKVLFGTDNYSANVQSQIEILASNATGTSAKGGIYINGLYPGTSLLLAGNHVASGSFVLFLSGSNTNPHTMVFQQQGMGSGQPAYMEFQTKRFAVTGDSYISGKIDLGNASDTTITRHSAGHIAVEGNRLLDVTDIGGTGGLVGDSGGAATEIAVWSSASNISGSSNLTYSSGHLFFRTGGTASISASSANFFINAGGDNVTTRIKGFDDNGEFTVGEHEIILTGSAPSIKLNNVAGGGLDPILQASGSVFRIGTSSDASIAVVDLSNNRLGIGVTDPQAKLEVKGASATPADGNEIISVTNTTGGSKLLLGVVENSYGWIQSAEGSTSRNLLLNPLGGNVGIGTTSPDEKLEVVGDIKTSGTGNTQVILESGGACVMDLLNAQSEAYLRTTSAHDLYFRTTNINRMVVKAAGNVGIGTTIPYANLEIQGPNIVNSSPVVIKKDKLLNLSLLTSGYYGGFAEFWMGRYADVANHAKSILTISLNDGLYGSNNNADTDVMTLRGDGNVGIGTNSPAEKLHVVGDLLVTGQVTGSTVKTATSEIKTDNPTDSALVTFTGQGAGAQANVGVLLQGTTATNGTIKLKLKANGPSGHTSGSGQISYNGQLDTMGLGQSTTHNSMAMLIDNDENIKFNGNLSVGVNSNTAFNSITPKIEVDGYIKSKIRRTANATSETAAADNETDYWTKLVTFDLSAATFNDFRAVYTLAFQETSALGYARILVTIRRGSSSSTLDVLDVTILDIQGHITSYAGIGATTIGQQFEEDGFILTNEGNSIARLWVKKANTYGYLSLWEDAINYDHPATSADRLAITYHNNSTWQSAVPSGANATTRTYMASTRVIQQYAFFTNTTGIRFIPLYSSFVSSTSNYAQRYLLPKPGRLVGVNLMCTVSQSNGKLRTYDADSHTSFSTKGSTITVNLITNIATWFPINLNYDYKASGNDDQAAAFSIQAGTSSNSYWNMAAVWQF